MTTKIAVSLPDQLVEAARRAVSEGRAASVSAYVAEALGQRVANDDVAALLADMSAETGAPNEDDRRWARRALGLT